MTRPLNFHSPRCHPYIPGRACQSIDLALFRRGRANIGSAEFGIPNEAKDYRIARCADPKAVREVCGFDSTPYSDCANALLIRIVKLSKILQQFFDSEESTQSISEMGSNSRAFLQPPIFEKQRVLMLSKWLRSAEGASAAI